MSMLDRKVFRDALHLKGQLLAITAMVACGVAVFIMLRSMHGYLRGSQSEYYADYGFAEVFANVRRAPSSLEGRLAAVPGVEHVYTRLAHDVILDVPGLPEPATGRLVSLPDGRDPPLNRLHLRTGRLPEAGRRGEVVASAAFAAANGLRAGDRLRAVLNGRLQELTIVGTAISPEFIYEVGGFGMFPDNRRYGALWLNRSAMAAAFELEGAFNDVAATLTAGASERAVLEEMDAILAPYGGIGAYGRSDHVSHEMTSSEIEETKITAVFFPAVFMLVTAFLLHTTLLRLVRLEREQIGLMKAFGITPGTIAFHYLKFALLPVATGTLIGVGAGLVLASRTAGLYADFFQFPETGFVMQPRVIWTALAIAVLTGITGALAATRSVVRLPPAVAMAPPSPPRFQRSSLEATAVWRALSPAWRIIVRNLARARWKSAATVLGIALTLGVLGAVLSIYDAVDYIAELQFGHTYREDVAVHFDVPHSASAIHSLAALPGVLRAEPIRYASARIRNGQHQRRVMLLGLQPENELRRIVDAEYRVHSPPPEGVLMSRMLADLLHVQPGGTVRIEITEGQRPVRDVIVAGLVDELIGVEVYMDAAALHHLLGEGPTITGAHLRVDPLQRDDLYAELKQMPGVAAVTSRDVLREGFAETIEKSFSIVLTMTLGLGALLVLAIVYNQARIALSERGRDLASLRVLGFTRREVARMLVGEQAVLVTAALPLGVLVGWTLVLLMMQRFATELFRLPVVMRADTYLIAIGVVIAAAALSALLVRRRLDRIDLISVLKTRE